MPRAHAGGEIAYGLCMHARAVMLVVVSLASVAHAEELERKEAVSALESVNDDGFTPGLVGAAMTERALVSSTLTYSGAEDHTALDFHGELHVWGPFLLVLRVDNTTDHARPGIGGAARFLDEREHGVAATAFFEYKAEGFTEAEGELEGLVAFGKQLGVVHGTLNLAYGQDPEGKERDGEAAVGLHVEAAHGLFAGVVGRYRDALGSDGDKGTGIVRDVLGAVTASYAVDRFGITASAGVAGVKLLNEGGMETGFAGALSVGAMF